MASWNGRLLALVWACLALLVLGGCTTLTRLDELARGEVALLPDDVHEEVGQRLPSSAAVAAFNSDVNPPVALFKIEPFHSPCCPEPTPEDAVLAAQAVPGVLAAELLEPETLQVRYNPDRVEILDIASAINRAAFFVTMEDEEDSDAVMNRAAGSQTWKVLKTEVERDTKP